MPPLLTQSEVRALGCLLEKEKLTPEAYPLTFNSLRLACNQKTSREPVMELGESDLSAALASLKAKNLLSIRTDARATRYGHSLERLAAFNQGQSAVMTLLMIRGPQTAGEIRGRSGRLFSFESPADVEQILEHLSAYEGGAWARRLERRPGEKEARWAHCLDGGVDSQDVQAAQELDRIGELESRIHDLEREVAALKARLGQA